MSEITWTTEKRKLSDIACERLGRKCRAIEISPAYVAVALQRFYDMTGVTPELVTE